MARSVFLVVSRQLVQHEEQTPETLLQRWEMDAELQERHGGEASPRRSDEGYARGIPVWVQDWDRSSFI